jgi:hypothetical protein
MNYPNYQDFYQKALIPIGSSDRASFSKLEPNPSFKTHWLIALQGELAPNSNEFYHWKVTIYPSNSEGSFKWNTTFYSSPLVNSFNKAIEWARTFETYSKNDQLLSTNLQEKIS